MQESVTSTEVLALVFCRDGTRADTRLPGRHSHVAMRAHEPLAATCPATDVVDVSFAIEHIADTGCGSSDGSAAIYAPPGMFRRFWHDIKRGYWEALVARGMVQRPLDARDQEVIALLGIPASVLERRYYDGHDVPDLFARLYEPFPYEATWYTPVWVKPQPPDATRGALRFEIIARTGRAERGRA